MTMSEEAQRWQEYHESGLWVDADLPNGESDRQSPSFLCCVMLWEVALYQYPAWFSAADERDLIIYISEQGIAPPLRYRIGHC